MTQLSVADVLERAADLIEPEGCWTQGSFARDAAGERIFSRDKRAQCWCMFGAIVVVGNAQKINEITDLFLDNFNKAPIAFNDTPGRTQAEVVSALRRAATLARQGDA